MRQLVLIICTRVRVCECACREPVDRTVRYTADTATVAEGPYTCSECTISFAKTDSFRYLKRFCMDEDDRCMSDSEDPHDSSGTPDQEAIDNWMVRTVQRSAAQWSKMSGTFRTPSSVVLLQRTS